MRTATPRQLQILSFISSFTKEEGLPPSYRQVASHFRITAGGLQKQIRALEKKGLLNRPRDRFARSFQINGGVAKGDASIPLLGYVRAGALTQSFESVESHLIIDESIKRGADFLLRVKGDSMVPEMLDGDLLLVKSCSDAQDGDNVVAEVDSETTVKRLRKNRSNVWLEAANSKYPEIRSENLRLIGKVVSLVRILR